jgi:hypothetical protein
MQGGVGFLRARGLATEGDIEHTGAGAVWRARSPML